MNSTTRPITPDVVKARIRRAFAHHVGPSSGRTARVLGAMTLLDRAYELACLVELLRQFKSKAHTRSFHLVGGSAVTFRQKGGPVRRSRYPYIEIRNGGSVEAEIWTNIEFTALSATHDPRGARVPAYPPRGDAHELDLVVLKTGTADGYPTPDAIHLGVEAKCRPYGKALLKELLGVRRESAFVADPPPGVLAHAWAWWPETIRAYPHSALVAYCNDQTILSYTQPARFYGIRMEHLP